MKLVYKPGLLLLLMVVLATTMHAHDLDRREFTKTIKKEFDISATGTTAIHNKYGKVNIKTWERNRVKVEVTIVVNAANETGAQRVFDRISVNFFNKADYVKAETIIEDAKRDWWNWSSYTSTAKNDYAINYEVYLPATNNLELSNRYGDTFVASMSGRVNVDIKYGNIKLQNVNNNSKVVLAYGNGSLLKVQNMTGDLSYARLDCNEANDVELVSKYSRVKLDKVGAVQTSTKYDNYEIAQARAFRNEGRYDNLRLGTVQDVIVNSKYTQVNVEHIHNLLDLNLGFGGASIGLVGKDFVSVNLVGSYTDFKLAVERSAQFKFDASGSYAGITYPSDLNISHHIEKGTSKEIRGHIGAQNARGVITARLNYGGLKVRQE